MDGLTEGRIVRYVTPQGEQHAAIVSKVKDRTMGLVNLGVWDDAGNSYNAVNVPYAEYQEHEKTQPSSWHWIERA